MPRLGTDEKSSITALVLLQQIPSTKLSLRVSPLVIFKNPLSSKKHTKLSEYLDRLKECNDERVLLEHDLKIYDNWPVLLFGNPDELFLKITNAFRNSPQENGIREPWHYISTESTGDIDKFYQRRELQTKFLWIYNPIFQN